MSTSLNSVSSISVALMNSPLVAFSLVALAMLACYLGSLTIGRHLESRRLWKAVSFLQEDQYRTATDADVHALLAAASRRGDRAAAEANLAQVKRLYGSEVKHGHLWWIAGKLAGDIPAHTLPPACVIGGTNVADCLPAMPSAPVSKD